VLSPLKTSDHFVGGLDFSIRSGPLFCLLKASISVVLFLSTPSSGCRPIKPRKSVCLGLGFYLYCSFRMILLSRIFPMVLPLSFFSSILHLAFRIAFHIACAMGPCGFFFLCPLRSRYPFVRRLFVFMTNGLSFSQLTLCPFRRVSDR